MQTLGLHMIAGPDRAAELDHALASLRPHMDQVFVAVTGDPPPEMREVLERHEVDWDTFTWCDDFAAARNFALSKMTTDWITWADTDDEVQDAAQLREYIEQAADDVVGCWYPYVYGRDAYGNITTVHIKERLLRASVGWEWKGRIHETIEPKGWGRWERFSLEPGKAVWVHNPTDAGEDHGTRNMRILQAWIEEEPSNLRLWYFIGNQYFALQDWANAAAWYRRFWSFNQGDMIGSSHDRWLAMLYEARARRFLNDVQNAIRADMGAITEFPEWADGYIGMTENMVILGDFEKGLAWAELAMNRGIPDLVAFVNELDYKVRLPKLASACYIAMGDFQRAREATVLALQTVPDDTELQENLEVIDRAIDLDAKVRAFQTFAPADPLAALKHVPKEVRTVRRVRDMWVPRLIAKTYKGTQPRIAFFVGRTFQNFTAETPQKEGIGGSETAVVEIAKRFAQAGWDPVVYGSPGDNEGVYDHVAYLDWQRARPETYHDVFVGWRRPESALDFTNAGKKLLWLHDLNQGPERMRPEVTELWDTVLGVSDWHRNYLARQFPHIAGSVDFVPNGIDLARFADAPLDGPRNRFRYVWASSPDRGLINLLRMWPDIHKVEPKAELLIFYGFDVMERQPETRDAALFLQRLIADLPGVELVGRVSQARLAQEFMDADLWVYPTSFLETSCITAMEAMAANLKIVTSASGNLPEVIGEAGICVPGHASTLNFYEGFMGQVFAMQMHVQERIRFNGLGPERAKNYTWDKAFEKWLEVI